jgi:hypothetical protein
MKKLFTLRKLFLLVCFIISVQGFAAFIGKKGSDNGNRTISLKNFNRNNYKANAYPSFRLSQFQFNGSQNIYQVNLRNSIEGQSMIRLQNGNTTYVYPYKYKVKVPFFKTPVSTTNH